MKTLVISLLILLAIASSAVHNNIPIFSFIPQASAASLPDKTKASVSSKPLQTKHNNAIAWQYFEQGNIETVFNQAKISGKPLFLYWGAVWCPPCNQVKATIFNRQDFIERSKAFIPVYLDGDQPGAQALGARFKVRGYPTMILFKPDGTEITRLPGGEVDPSKYMQVLSLGMNATRPVKTLLNEALSSKNSLSEDDWRLLAYYAWDVDEAQIINKERLASTLQQLAAACPPELAEVATRLRMRALAVAAENKKDADALDKTTALQQLSSVLADAEQSRANFDVIVSSTSEIVGALTTVKSSSRTTLSSAWNNALDRLLADNTLSVNDRISALSAKVDLAKIDFPEAEKNPKVFSLTPELLKQIRETIAQANQTTRNPYEREALIPNAADVLTKAGLLEESDALLTAQLAKSATPYYPMLGLAGNAKKRGDIASSLHWRQRAWEASKGPATRIQWGAGYVNSVIELAPEQITRIEQSATSIIKELEAKPTTFEERNQRSLERMGKKLQGWSAAYKQPGVFNRLASQMAKVCEQLEKASTAKTRCYKVFETSELTGKI
ncbi:MAG: thioredoxin family protein [Burkholderiaceae bacterium]|nr:thioredoxin family protein [Burkholderiaceae bacterium]